MEKDAEGFYTPAPDSKAEAPPEQEDSAYSRSLRDLGGQPQIPARTSTDQTRIHGLETDLIKSTFDVTVRRVELLRSRNTFVMDDGWANPFPFLLGHGRRPTAGSEFTVVQRQDV